MLVGAIQGDDVALVQQVLAVDGGQLSGDLGGHQGLDDDLAVVHGLDLGVVDILLVAFQLHGVAVGGSQLTDLVDEAQAALGDGLGNGVLRGHADAHGAFGGSDAILDGLVDLLAGQSASVVVVGGAVGQDRAFGSAGHARVKADDRDAGLLGGLDGVQAGLGGQGGQADSLGRRVDGGVQLGQLLVVGGLVGGADEVDLDAELSSLGLGAGQHGLPVLVLEALGHDLVIRGESSGGAEDQHQSQDDSQHFLHGDTS